MFLSKKKGFTLIELLVVVAIIGVLASVVLASLGSARSKARDTKKFADLKSLQTALAIYYTDYGRYPGSSHYRSNDTDCSVLPTHTLWNVSGIFDLTFTSNYMSTLPNDPSGKCYTYFSNSTGTSPTAWRCYTPSATLDPNLYYYLLTFEAESGLSTTIYPGLNSLGSTRRCILGPAI